MDWQKQTQDMLNSWTDSQKKLWDNWTESVQNFTGVQNDDIWAKTVETWQGSVTQALNTQNELSKAWVNNLNNVEGTPEQFVEWAKQSQEMSTRWNELQQQLWNNWFEVAKKVEPANVTPGFDVDAGKKVFEAWQDAAQQAFKVQTDWVNTFTGQAQEIAKKATKK